MKTDLVIRSHSNEQHIALNSHHNKKRIDSFTIINVSGSKILQLEVIAGFVLFINFFFLLQEYMRVWKWTCSSSESSRIIWFKSTYPAACWSSYRGCLFGWTPMLFQLACLLVLQPSWQWPHKLLASTIRCLPFLIQR